MKIESPRFGTLDIAAERIIEFPRGLVGFEHCTRFALFHPEGEAPTYYILQSLDEPAIAFQIADPARFGFGYEIELSAAEAAELASAERRVSSAGGALAVMVILSNEGEGKPVRANLNGPLVLNLDARRGLQHVFVRLDYNLDPKPV